MLVLTRKIEEEIVLGDNIRLRILSLRGNTVRIGIEAPDNVRIMRGELTCQLPENTEAQPSFPGRVDLPAIGGQRWFAT